MDARACSRAEKFLGWVPLLAMVYDQARINIYIYIYIPSAILMVLHGRTWIPRVVMLGAGMTRSANQVRNDNLPRPLPQDIIGRRRRAAKYTF